MACITAKSKEDENALRYTRQKATQARDAADLS